MPSPTPKLSLLVEKYPGINIFCHQSPDGDALGSIFALKQIFDKKTTVKIYCQKIPEIYAGLIKFTPDIDEPSDKFLNIIVDADNFRRVGYGDFGEKDIVLIDHHRGGQIAKKAILNFCDTKASSTAEVVFNLLENENFKINKAAATALLLGIYTDTGALQYSNTTCATLDVASRLIGLGANVAAVGKAMNGSAVKKGRLWGVAINKIKINKLGVASICIDKNDLDCAGASVEDAGGLVALLSQIEGVKLAIVLIETDGGWKVSAKAKSAKINVCGLAKMFDGKGVGRSARFVVDSLLKNDKNG